nr:hypothetical protein [Allomuricauda sp.]
MALKKHLYPLLLLTLIVFKVFSAPLHMHLNHGDDHEHIEHCDLCEQALFTQNLEFSSPLQLQIADIPFTVITTVQNNSYQSVFVTKTFNNTLFGRPPPTPE